MAFFQTVSTGDRMLFVEPSGSGLIMYADKLSVGANAGGFGVRKVLSPGVMTDSARLSNSDLLGMEGALIRSSTTGKMWEVKKGRWISRGAVDTSSPDSLSALAGITSKTASVQTHRLRGMTCDQVNASPSSEEYWDLFTRFKPNAARIFLSVQCDELGSEYRPTDTWGGISWDQYLQNLSVTLQRGYARGVQFIPVMVPLRTNPDKNSTGVLEDRKLTEWWQSQAAMDRYIDRLCDLTSFLIGNPAVVAIDSINEPLPLGAHSQAASDALVAFHNRAFARMRAIDPIRTFVATCGAEGATQGFEYMKPVEDENVWYSLHAYQPFLITHALVDSNAPAYTGGFPSTIRVAGGLDYLNTTPANTERLRMELKPARDFQLKYGKRMFVGEYGCAITNAAGVPAQMTEDWLTLFEEYGWDHIYHAFGFPTVPFLFMQLPTSTESVAIASGSIVIQTATGATNQSRTPAAPAGQVFEKNNFHSAAPQPRKVQFVRYDNFEIAGGDFSLSQFVSGGGTVDVASTLYPLSGTKHALCQHNNAADNAAAYLQLPDWGSVLKNKYVYLEMNLRLGAAIGAGKNLCFFFTSSNGQGTAPYSRIVNISGTNTFAWEIWKGSGDYNARPFRLIDGLTLPVGAYTKIAIEIITDPIYGRFRVSQNGRVLTDINTDGNITNVNTDYLWTPQIGLVSSDQRLQSIAVDEVKYSLGGRGF